MSVTTPQMRAYRNNNQSDFRRHKNVEKHLRIARATTGQESEGHYSKAAKLHKKYHGIV